MSISKEIKNEILEKTIENDCCILSRLAACINTIGSLDISKQGISFSLNTDNLELLKSLQKNINRLYSDKIEQLELPTKIVGKHTVYELSLPKSLGNMILRDCGIIALDETNNYTINREIDHHLLLSDCCKKTYLETAFVTVGQVCVPANDVDNLDKKSSGYHFEIELNSNEQAKVIANLLGEFGFIARKTERGDKYLVYMKESESIADFIAFIGATKSYLKIQDQIIKRIVKNNVNRQSNCYLANVDKTVQASLLQLHAIEVIDSTIGLNQLPENLKKYALLRQRNPEASLLELIELSGESISKSGINYKLNKIIEISKNL